MAPRLYATALPLSLLCVLVSHPLSLRARRLSDLHTSILPLSSADSCTDEQTQQGFPAALSLVGAAAEKNNVSLVWTLQV